MIVQPLMPQLPQAAALPLDPLPAQALDAGAALLLAGPAQGERAPESFAGELALGAEAAGEALPTPPSLPLPAAELSAPSSLPLSAAELPALPLDVERLLHSLLQQRDVQLQAREGEAGEAPTVAEEAFVGFDGSSVMRLPMPPQPQPQTQSQPQPLAVGPAMAVAIEPAAMPTGDAAPRPTSAPLPADSGVAAPTAGVASELAPAVAGERPPAAPGVAPAPQAAQPAQAMPLPEQRLALHGPEAKWGEQMLNALRDSVELQVRQGMQQATIRLDPPELGSLEIFLSHEGGRLQVQISAAQGEVARLLQQTSERLRQELVGQHFVQVDVEVGADAQSGQRHGQQGRPLWRDEVPLAAREGETRTPAAKSGKSADVLVTV